MKKNTMQHPWYQRLLAFGLAGLMAFGAVPLNTRAEVTTQAYTEDLVTTVADDQTLGRPDTVYGKNTKNAGKVTVGKSVHNGAVTIQYGDNKSQTFTPAQDNFIITSSQAAQVVGLASESAAPVDVVFVLDTSSSMSSGRAASMVTAANNAISSLMAANPYNRIGVVAFSSNAWSDVNDAAAEQLSALAHYDDVDSNNDGDLNDRNDVTAASNHLRWGSSNGTVSNNGSYIIGRGSNAGTRHGIDGGTNIHAGIALAAEMLMDATDTTVQIDGKNVTRMPFLVVLSDGAPTYSSYTSNGSDTKWYDPNMTNEHGPGDSFYVGNGFLAALTAAYYKGAITEKYFGTNASEKNRCYIYTIGVGLSSLTGNEGALAQITMDPDTYFKTGSTNKYYNGNNNHDFFSYWEKYTAANPREFTVQVNSGNSGTTTISVDSINATKNYVNGLNASGTKMYDGGLAYNDDYFTANQTADINSAFEKALTQIQLQAMSVPTRVEETHGADFSGYVTYTDPIGEYMEVKQVFGVLADGNYYQGKTFAQNMQNWNTTTSQEFKDHFLKVLKERCKVTGASLTDAQLLAIIEKAVASGSQAYYNSDADYDNSFVWFGKSYKAEGEEDVQIQILDFAEDDSIEYITDPNTTIPDGADYVCRSYYYYGTAGGAVANPNNEYLHFVVRVQRSLKAPYQETVVISAPASLLSMEKVLITEKTDAQGNKTYTASITEADPARVVYEVGLRSDINGFNVEQILKQDAQAAVNAYDYTAETAVSGTQTVYSNYDAAKGEYYFYTNDWNRGETGHHRAMTHATFDAAADNSFYTYTQDTPIYKKNGDTYTLYNGTEKPSGEYYYAREVYDWSASTATGNTHAAVRRTEYILVDIPADSPAVKKGSSSWYIEKGAYKASSLSTAVEDIPKSDPERTGTAAIVAHPHRTEDVNNSHYTVLLGNNGKLTLKTADTKDVSITSPDRTDYNGTAVPGTTIQDADGKVVMVGDVLTYTVKVINGGSTTADAVAADKIPTGTAYVDGSASQGGIYDSNTNTITWNIDGIPAGHFVEVTFQVRVTEAALTGDLDVVTIDNQAYVRLSNGFEYDTNTTSNPPEGKKAVDTDGQPITGDVEVPDVLVYRIRWYNDSGSVADVTITDKIPTGTTYHADSARPAATKVENGIITWVIEDVQPGASGVVSFRVNVNAAAGAAIENGAKIQIGENDPRVTNKTSVTVATGSLKLHKAVNGYPAGAEPKSFTLTLTEVGLGLNGSFAYTQVRNGVTTAGTVTFTNGIGHVTVMDGSDIIIEGLPAGAIISVTEVPMSGFTAVFETSAGISSAEGRVAIAADAAVFVNVGNTYSPKAVEFELTATKKLNAAVDAGQQIFGFTAYPCDASGVVTGGAPLTGEVTVSGAAGENTGTIRFGAVRFDAAGSYYYLVSEINGGVAGVNYTTQEYLVQIDVTDNGSGQLTAAVTAVNGSTVTNAGDSVTFVNSYVPSDTQLTLEATKVLDGRDLRANEFSFAVKDGNNNEITYGTNDDTGKITFRPITYTAQDIGTHVYYITENTGSAPGVGYSAASYKVVVTVSDNAGSLEAKVTSVNDAAVDSDYTDDLVFTNTFTPDDAKLELEASKTLVNNTGDAAFGLKADQFAFQVLDQSGAQVAFGANDAYGKVKFSPIVYTRAMLGTDNTETFVYTVRELIPDALGKNPSIKYDETAYTVTVTVIYDTAEGKIKVGTPLFAVEGAVRDTISFTNIQQPTYIDAELSGTKTTNGSNLPAGLSFSFSVVDTNGEVVSGGAAAANGEIAFTNLTYTTPGDYYYWIHESNHAGQSAHGVKYDGMCYLVHVKIYRDSDSVLQKEVTYYRAEGALENGKVKDPAGYAAYITAANQLPAGEKMSFTNEYAAQGHLELQAQKVLKVPAGSTHGIVAGDYLFRLDRLDANGEVISSMYATNNSSGTVNFPSLVFTNNDLSDSPIRYVMSEVVTDANRLPGVTYNTTKYYISVSLTANGEKIEAAAAYYSDADFTAAYTGEIEFVNNYAPETGTSATFKVNKKMEGRAMQPGEFSFLLYHVTTDAEGNPVETLVDVATNTVNAENNRLGGAVFVRSYAATVTPGTYKYAIVEHRGSLGGVTYSDAKYWALVTIRDNGSGALVCDGVTYYSDEGCTQQIAESDVLFVNSYQPSETVYTPTAGKILNNRDMQADEFAFVVTEYGTSNVVSTGYNKAAASGVKADITFTSINYTFASLAGATSRTFLYEIREAPGQLTGVSYTDTVYYLQVTLTDNLDGTMDVDHAYFTDAACTTSAADVTFVNTFTPQSVTVQLEATKMLENHPMRQGNFSFLVHDITGGGNKLVASGGNAAADANAAVPVTFTTIGYSFSDLGGAAEKTFLYTITEQATTLGGVTHDGTVYYAKVILKHNTNGTMTTAVSYYTDRECRNAVNGVPAFVNTYDPADVEVTLYADKTLINKKLQAGEFTFTLSGNGIEKTAVNNADGRATFGKLTFTEPGTYKFTITEAVTDSTKADLYTLDNPFHAYVVVEDNLKGQLVATVSYHEVNDSGVCGPETNLGGAEFINHYTAPELTVPLNTQIGATKTVNTPDGVTYSAAGFKFAVTDVTGAVVKGWENGVEVDMIGTSGTDGKITFPDFRFPKAGEYHYWITEQPSGAEGMTDDLRTWEVHILVRYNDQTGLLYVEDGDVKTFLIGRTASEVSDPSFVNVFEPTPITLAVTVDKVLEGRELKDREFLFYLMEGNAIVAQGHNDVNGNVKFDLTYTAEDIGVHAYTVKEVVPDNAGNGVTYDTESKAVPTITISYDEENHKLVAKANGTPVANGAVVDGGETFYNKYTTQGTTVQINAHKVITANRVLKDQEFTFNLFDSEGKFVQTAKNDAAGWITFQLSYDKAGVYTYEMAEQPGEDRSLRYDTNRYKVTVTVTDDLLGQLHAVVEYEDGAEPTFVNEYKPLSASTAITAKKTLLGNKTLAAGDFTFELESEDGVKATAKNAAGGVVMFGMRYDAAGVYTYKLREVAGDAAGVTYDDAEYRVVVTVIDNLEGSLVATVAYEGLADGEAVPTFVNTYQGKAASVQISASKKLSGKTLAADAFTFTLTNKANERDIYTAKNDAQGNVVFDLNLTEVGTYTYILAETAGADANITYDKNTYTVTVKVTDDLQGNLKAEVTYDTTDGKAPTFTNVHTPSAITVELTGRKTLKGRELKADEFAFQVTDGSGNVVATAKNDAAGELKFSGIALSQAGKYTFAVTEVKGSVKGMIYDDAKYIVTVEVVNENGVLKATVTEPESGLVFQNTYKTPDPENPGTGDDTPLLLLVGLMVVSGGAVVALLANRKKRRA